MVSVTLLGVAQDGGVPHIGCDCINCSTLSSNVACLAVTIEQHNSTFLIDATPDIKHQLAQIRRGGSSLAGVFLTHLHMGHYAGLLQLGKEALNTRELPCYATDQVCTWLRTNEPWATLVNDRNIQLCQVVPDQPVRLAQGCTITPILVPHRRDHSDTVAYVIQGGTGDKSPRCAVMCNPVSTQMSVCSRLLYCPDTDGFAEWQPSLAAVLANVDVALLDGTFFDALELPNRDLSTIPHPMCCDTARILHAIDACEPLPSPTGVQGASRPPGAFSGALKGKEVAFVHLNHSNPLWRRDSTQRAWLEGWGVRVAQEGDAWSLTCRTLHDERN